MAEMAPYGLTYFDGRGRAEVMRYLFVLSQTPYEDVRVSFADWAALKPSTPFGQLPLLRLGGETYCQSGAIMRFLARRFGFYGDTNEDGLKIDQIWGVVTDIVDQNIALSAAVARRDDAGDAERRRKEFFDAEVPKLVAFLEAQLRDGDGDWLVGCRVSLADAIVYEFFTGLLCGDGSLGDWKRDGLRVARLVDRFGALPEIAAYVARRPRSTF